MANGTGEAPPDGDSEFDVLIIGGGVNGAGIARDAAGRGYSVCLCESGDFGGGTSSASTKLLHGGLRYLEYFEFRLVREALIERENLLAAMPHISWPLRFVLPYHADMRFEADTPAWLKGSRPAWLIRLGLFMYDHMGGRSELEGTRTLDLSVDPAGKPLQDRFRKAFEYSDCWVEDSRLVILNLRDAQQRGAQIRARTRVSRAEYQQGRWKVTLASADDRSEMTVTASMIVNAAGPWVDEVLKTVFGQNDAGNVRLVRGSHIVIPKKFEHDRCYFFQNVDGRIIFAIPYERDYTLIGTTDADHRDMHEKPRITAEETRYLCSMASEYFREPVSPDDIVWTYSGVRPLYDDGVSSAQAATRDYVVRRDKVVGQGSLVNIFGGKITTFRRLAEATVAEIEDRLGSRGRPWTCRAPFPGGDFPVDGFARLLDETRSRYAFLDADVAARLVRAYGTEVDRILAGIGDKAGLGRDFGHGLFAAEVEWLMDQEWARTAEDVLFRRTRLGIRMEPPEIDALDEWMAQRRDRTTDG